MKVRNEVERLENEISAARKEVELADQKYHRLIIEYVEARNKNESLWTVAQAAAYLNASEGHVRTLVENGTLASRKIGGIIRFDADIVRNIGRRK